MSARPFLSHKREDASDLELLRAELALRGAAGWQDVHELRLGERWKRRFLLAIGRDTNGFIWWGTRRSLSSTTICKLELPRALRRARPRWYRRRTYPVVPLFVDLSPNADREAIAKALGAKRAAQLGNLHGVVREQEEPIERFARRAARQYIKDVVRSRPTAPLRIEISGGRQPTLNSDLALDWRDLLDERGDPISETAVAVLTETLADIREAAQGSARLPHFVVEPHLRVPLGALVGWEWNKVRPVKLDVVQVATAGSCLVSDEHLEKVELPEAEANELGGEGPGVVAISVGNSLKQTLVRYGEETEARETIHLHLPLEEGRLLNGPEIVAGGAWAVQELARLHDHGSEKHLIVLGPVSMAVWIGANAHGTGKTWVPFWDGESGYSGGIEIGGSSLRGAAKSRRARHP